MDTDLNKIDAYILTGGQSRRFTADKCLAKINGKTLTEIIYAKLSVVFDNVYIVGKDNPFSHINFVKDMNEVQCPLNGIATALDHSKSDFIFVIACDMPLVKNGTISNISKEVKVTSEVVLSVVDSQNQPLCAFYSKEILPKINTAIKKKEYSLMKLLDQLDVAKIAISNNDIWQFLNVNYPADLKKAERILK